MQLMSRLSILAGIALLTSPALQAIGTHTPRPAGTVAGTSEGYYEYLPEGYDENSQATYPVLFFFHGIGENGNGSAEHLNRLLDTGLPSLLDDASSWPATPPGGVQEEDIFVILSLQSAGGFPGFQRIDTFIDFALSAYRLNPERVYLTGLSAGAITIFNYLSGHYQAGLPDRIAAAIPIAGQGNNVVLQNACLFAHIPVWAFHGSTDTQVPTQGSIDVVNAMDACVPTATDARVTLFPGIGHSGGVWNRVYDLGRMGTEDPNFDPFLESVYDWLLSYTRGGASALEVFSDGFESGDTSGWSTSANP